jgi:prepilin peptidase CpaA
MIATAILLGLVLAATITDLRWQTIPNALTYSGILLALGMNAAGSLVEYGGEAATAWRPLVGWVGLADSLAGLAACGFLMLACFVFFSIGGGDVKLIAMMGAFLGLEQGLEAMLWTFVLGACLALVVLVWRVGPWQLMGAALRHLLAVIRLRGWIGLDEAQRGALQPPLYLAPCAAVAVGVVKFRWLDWW